MFSKPDVSLLGLHTQFYWARYNTQTANTALFIQKTVRLSAAQTIRASRGLPCTTISLVMSRPACTAVFTDHSVLVTLKLQTRGNLADTHILITNTI